MIPLNIQSPQTLSTRNTSSTTVNDNRRASVSTTIDEHQFTGHGNRLSYLTSHSRHSLPTSSAKGEDSKDGVTEWHDQDAGDSNFSAFINLVTGAIGSGVVYLPSAAGGSGLILALILISIMGLVSAHTTSLVGLLLLMSRNAAKKVGLGEKVETFEDMAKVVWGKVGFVIVCFVNYLDLYLTVAVFMGTLAATVSNAVWTLEQGKEGLKTHPDPDAWRYYVFLAGFIVLVLPLCCLKSMHAISKMSIAGVLANVVILVCIIISACDTSDRDDFKAYISDFNSLANNPNIKCHNDSYKTMFPNGKTSHTYFDFSKMWQAYGNFGFSYAVAVVTPSLVVGMKQPKKLGPMVWSSHLVITLIYAAIIVVSWCAWGNGIISYDVENATYAKDDTKKEHPLSGTLKLGGSRNIIDNLFMPNAVVQTIAASMLVISIVSSVPLFFFSIAVFVEEKFREKFPNMNERAFRYMNRTILLVITTAPALMGEDNLGSFQGLTGALTTTAMCAIIPNIMYFGMAKLFPEGHPFKSKGILFAIICGLACFVGCCTLVIGFIFDGLEGLFKIPIS